MSEIFRFMTMRAAQLADPTSTAIDLGTFTQTRDFPVPEAAMPMPELHFEHIYETLAAEFSSPHFDPARTSEVINEAVADQGGLDSFVTNGDYLQDKSEVAVALITAHLKAPTDARIATLATYARVMNLIDSVAGGEIVDTAAALQRHLGLVLLAPPGTFPLQSVGPPYNPDVVPAGVADLYVVNQELQRYELKDVSFIANVLQSESNKRVTTRFEKTDQTYTTTTDTTTQTEQDTESAQRFQLQTQAQNTINENSSLNFGLTVSASYGPSVSANSNFNVASNTAKSYSQNVSSSYANDVTTSTVSKVTQEVSQQQRLDVINSFKEQVEHGFDNTAGTGNISGVYQYVDAVYEVGMFNYGQRLLLDLIAPNPGALIRGAIQAANSVAVTAYDPPPIEFGPENLTVPAAMYDETFPPKTTWSGVGNLWPSIAPDPSANSGTPGVDYSSAAETYQVAGLSPPPSRYVVAAWSNVGSMSGGAPIAPVTDHITIPDGYMATQAIVQASMAAESADSPYILVVQLGASQQLRIGNEEYPNSPPAGDTAENQPIPVVLGSEIGQLPVTVASGSEAAYTLNIEVLCQLTNEAFAKWQLDTYSTIYQSYLSLLSTYQQAAGQGQQSLAGSSYAGSSPDENLRVVQVELTRAVLSLLTLQQFDAATGDYDAATSYALGALASYNGTVYESLQGDNTGYEPDTNPEWWAPVGLNPSLISTATTISDFGFGPASGTRPPQDEINFTATFAQGPMIRFLQEAFEWDQMQYIFYPYYWNPKSKWLDLALLEDSDPLFAQFLRAGAGRVVIPVRPGFEVALIYFLQTGQPWDGGSVPQVYDPLYLSIATEIAEAEQQPVAETLVGSTWTMYLPTTLTMLRGQPSAPADYDPNATYPLGAVVSYNDVRYASLQGANAGHQPDTNPTWWAPSDPSLPSWTLDTDLTVLASD